MILGGLIFRGLEAEQVHAIDMQRVKDKHVGLLWNLTAAMNVLHPRNWSTVAMDVINNYTLEVISLHRL